MNIVTRQLLKSVHDPALVAFVRAWDRLELLVIDVYKRGSAGPDEEQAYAELNAYLVPAYAIRKTQLVGYWRGLTSARRSVEGDPFEALLARRAAEDFVGDWEAMQTLPVARQAINHFLLDHQGA